MKKQTLAEEGTAAANSQVDALERIARALELVVEKLSGLENKIEDLTYEIQSHGSVIGDSLAHMVNEGGESLPFHMEADFEGGCGSGGCGSGGCGGSGSN
ncbi:MAG: hypothetical protein SFV17_04835 [Candidatus Obscuribacter sp.]|nr:hypothetical protein [Candidatus Melainabacteria bacterium]MDX1985995.1 hypothetical protein [Candidatus Obscuribacter sp.]